MMRQGSRYRQQSRGLSLIELAIVMAISSVVGGAIYQTFHTQQKTYQRQNAMASMQQNGRTALLMMNRELHTGGYDGRSPLLPPRSASEGSTIGFVRSFPPPHNTAISIVDYGSATTKLAFTSDANNNGVFDATPTELIAYRFDAANHALERYNAGNSRWEVLADDVDGVHFNYLDNAGNPTTNPNFINSVELYFVFRSGQKDLAYTDKNRPYRTQGGLDICPACATEPHYRRQLLRTIVKIRNP